MTKAILFDADGVVLKKYKEYFVSQYFAREYNAPADEVNAFFEKDFRTCQRGKLDLKEELAKYLPGWNWQNGVDAFLEYWFTTDATIDSEVMKEVEKIREKGFKCYLVSDQEKYRANYIMERLGLKNKFDGYFFSYQFGYMKSQPEYFAEIFKITGLKPEEFIYFDDDQKNVDIATSLGINAYFYTNIDDLKKVTNI
ncbi:MAG: HAD-IA family hydrolase [bacterium]|nr:HAD-IA family hydrolase [bacterium]